MLKRLLGLATYIKSIIYIINYEWYTCLKLCIASHLSFRWCMSIKIHVKNCFIHLYCLSRTCNKLKLHSPLHLIDNMLDFGHNTERYILCIYFGTISIWIGMNHSIHWAEIKTFPAIKITNASWDIAHKLCWWLVMDKCNNIAMIICFKPCTYDIYRMHI